MGDRLLFLEAIILLTLAVSCQPMSPPVADQTPATLPPAALTESAEDLPAADLASTRSTDQIRVSTISATILGVEMDRIAPSAGLDIVAQAKTGWIRRNAVLWSEVEPTPGARNWAVLSGIEAELRNAADQAIPVILIVRSTPTWARNTHAACGAIKKDALGSFGAFMQDLVMRYSVPPFNVMYWELWNEPDVDPTGFDDEPFGCWGDQSDPYYGGEYYAEMLKTVYPPIKAANPGAQVLIGGLLLDCDPNHPPAGKDCKPARFLEGIVRSGGAAFFDGASYHAYDYYLGALGEYSNPNWASAWDTTGPASIAKARFIKQVLTKYNVSGKFLMNTESALLCDGGPERCNSVYETTKTYYLTQLYAAAICEGLSANVWFSVLGWRSSGLVSPSQQPLPAFAAYSFGSRELQGAQFSREIAAGPGVKGYEFSRGERRIWLLWSTDRATHSITLAQAPKAIYEVDGTPTTVSDTPRVSMEPLYLEWSP